MALLDLGLVTRCFTNLLQQRIPEYPVWPSTANLLVSGGPPDAVKGAHALSFYLYHVREDAHTKNQDFAQYGGDSLRFTPMGLTLSYVLSPRSNTADPDLRAQADQLMAGLALKTLRDHSLIDDSSAIITGSGLVVLMPLAMRGKGNRLRCTLQPTPATEASNYWQAGTTATRLSAYYEVAATLLEPDEPTSLPGRVLQYGVHTFVGHRPWIDRIQNSISFTLPGETQPRSVSVSPASVSFGEKLEISGSNLSGDAVSLFLRNRDWTNPVEADPAWLLKTDGSTLTCAVQATASGMKVRPGIFGASVRTISRRTLPDGAQRDFDSWSNELEFAIAPAILSVTGGTTRTVKVDQFEPHQLRDDELLMFLGPAKLTRSDTSPPGPGEYFTPSSPAAAQTTLRFKFPSSAVSGSVLPLRLIVRGAESAPLWEVVP